MSDADWPAPEPAAPRDPERRPAPLPRIEDLPIAEQGYDREKVREAFDAFYRHAAQLDATLSTLEAVEAFQRTSAELRAELRTIRGSGWTVQSWQGGGYGTGGRVSEWSLPPAFPRVALEALFLIVMGVIVGVAGWSRLTIVLVMALALGVVWLIEWVAARERAIPQAAVAPVAVPDLDEKPAEPVAPAAAAQTWAEQQEEGPEAMTMLGAPPARASEEPQAARPAEEPPEEPEEPEAPEEPEEPEKPPAPEPVADVTAEDVLGEAEPAAAEPEPEPEPQPAAEAEPAAEPGPPAAEPEPAAEVLDERVPERVALDEPEPARRFGRLRRRHDEVDEATEHELVAAAEPIEDEVLDGARELELEESTEERQAQLDPWEQPAVLPGDPLAAPAPEPDDLAEPEPGPEPPLPADALAEQAAAARERARTRRRTLRRARRR